MKVGTVAAVAAMAAMPPWLRHASFHGWLQQQARRLQSFSRAQHRCDMSCVAGCCVAEGQSQVAGKCAVSSLGSRHVLDLQFCTGQQKL
jgi:hypothetical protein